MQRRFCALSNYHVGEIYDFHLKHLGHNVNVLRFSVCGDNYTVVYGFGIDDNKRIWNKIKADWLGKRLSRKIDRIINNNWENDDEKQRN